MRCSHKVVKSLFGDSFHVGNVEGVAKGFDEMIVERNERGRVCKEKGECIDETRLQFLTLLIERNDKDQIENFASKRTKNTSH